MEQPTAHARSLADKLRRAADEERSPWTDEGTCLIFSDAAKTLESLAASLREAEADIRRLREGWDGWQKQALDAEARLRVAEEALRRYESEAPDWLKHIARAALAGVGDKG